MQKRSPPAHVPTECEPLWQELSRILPTSQETEFLRVCLHTGESVKRGWERWCESEGDWRRSLARGKGVRMFPLLYRGLAQSGIELDATAAGLLRRRYMTALITSREYADARDELLGTLSANGLGCLVLKGAALGRAVYPSPELRGAGDIDILLRNEDLPAGVDCLLSAGWHWSEVPADLGRHQLTQLLHRSGLPVELHRRLFHSTYYRLSVDDLWVRSRTLDLGDGLGRMLSAEDNVIHVCEHAVSCHTRESLRWVADVWFLLHENRSFDWPRLVAVTTGGRLSLPLAVTLSYLADSLEAPVPKTALEELWREAGATNEMGRRSARLGAETSAYLRDLKGATPAARAWRQLRHTFWSSSPDEIRLRFDGPLLRYYAHRLRHLLSVVWQTFSARHV